MIVEASEPLFVQGADSVFDFQTTGTPSWPVWDRFISFRGGLKFEVGNICNTCDFFFTRLSDGTSDARPTAQIARALNDGISSLQSIRIGDIVPALPDGAYRVALSVGVPQLIHPGEPDDFFASEQVELWKADPTILGGPVHDPKTAYYRFGARHLGNGRALYELVVPTIPVDKLDANTIERYSGRAERTGAALAVSVLDVKGPQIYEDTPQLEITEHWVLAHYLLDGNHKTYAAARRGQVTSVLSFITLDHGISTEQQLSEALTTGLR